MKHSLAAFAVAAASLVHAQGGAGTVEYYCVSYALAVPTCATSCLDSAASSVGGCAPLDFACQCSNSAAVATACAQSIAQSCATSDALAAASAGSSLCSCVTSVEMMNATVAETTRTATPFTTGTAVVPATTPTGGVSGAASPSVTIVQASNGAATVGALLPAGGVMGALVALLAYL